MTPRLVAFDLDGTLAASKQPLEPSMGALLAHLLEKMPIAVMSGGSYSQFQKQFLSGMPPDSHFEQLYLFPTNAAACYAYKNGSWQALYDLSLTREEKHKIRNAFAAALMMTDLSDEPQVWGERIEDRGAQISFSGLGQEAPLENKKTWDPDQKKRLALQRELEPMLSDFSVRIGGMTTVDVTRKGVTKVYGLEQLAKLCGVPINEMLYIGDALFPGGNDEVVKGSGVQTREVTGPEDTAALIQALLGQL